MIFHEPPSPLRHVHTRDPSHPSQFCYTGMTVAAHFVGGTGDTSHLSMEQRLAFTPAQAAARQAGTKWFMVGWYTYVGLIWTLKLNMLFFYRRVVGVVWVKKLIMPTMIFVASTGLAIWILLATACRPFHKLWQILPDPGSKSPRTVHSRVLLFFYFLGLMYSHRSLHAAKSHFPTHHPRAQPHNRPLHNPYSHPDCGAVENILGPQNGPFVPLLRRHLHHDCSYSPRLLCPRCTSTLLPTLHLQIY